MTTFLTLRRLIEGSNQLIYLATSQARRTIALQRKMEKPFAQFASARGEGMSAMTARFRVRAATGRMSSFAPAHGGQTLAVTKTR
jgi:hypothetical protein